MLEKGARNAARLPAPYPKSEGQARAQGDRGGLPDIAQGGLKLQVPSSLKSTSCTVMDEGLISLGTCSAVTHTSDLFSEHHTLRSTGAVARRMLQ